MRQMIDATLPIGIISGVAAILGLVTNQNKEPYYGYIASLYPPTSDLYSAKQTLRDSRDITIDNNEEILKTIHNAACDEYDLYDSKTPIGLDFTYSTFRFKYSNRESGRGEFDDPKQELIDFLDSKISEKLSSLSLSLFLIAILGLVTVIILSTI